jgi:hypothetical protein
LGPPDQPRREGLHRLGGSGAGGTPGVSGSGHGPKPRAR